MSNPGPWQQRSPEEEQRRAGEARVILDSPMFKEARERVEGTIAHHRRRVPLRETEMHTRLILMEQLWMQLVDFLEETAQTGKFADLEIARRNAWIERLKVFER